MEIGGFPRPFNYDMMEKVWNEIKSLLPELEVAKTELRNAKARLSKILIVKCSSAPVMHKILGIMKALKDSESPSLTWRDPRDGCSHRLRCAKRESREQRRAGIVFTNVWQKVYDSICDHENWTNDDGPRIGVDKARAELFVSSKNDARVLLTILRDGKIATDYDSFSRYGIDKNAADNFAAILAESHKNVE